MTQLKMKYSIKILFLFFTIFLQAQNIDNLANIPSELKETEIRIYKDRGITNSGLVFRIYKENNIWKAELIQWFLPKEISKDEFEIIPPKLIVLKSKKPLEEIFVNIEAKNIKYLPKEETFEYKKSRNKVIFDDTFQAFITTKAVSSVLDGTGYFVRYKSGEQANEFNYDNPETYLEKYPEIDELNYFVDILNYIRKEFNINF